MCVLIDIYSDKLNGSEVRQKKRLNISKFDISGKHSGLLCVSTSKDNLNIFIGHCKVGAFLDICSTLSSYFFAYL